MTEPVKPNNSEDAPVVEVVSNSQTVLAPQAATSPPISPGGSGSGGRGLGIVALFFSLAALAVSGYSYYQDQIENRVEDTQLTIKMVEIGGDVARIGDSLSRLQADQSNVVSKEFMLRVRSCQTKT